MSLSAFGQKKFTLAIHFDLTIPKWVMCKVFRKIFLKYSGTTMRCIQRRHSSDTSNSELIEKYGLISIVYVLRPTNLYELNNSTEYMIFRSFNFIGIYWHFFAINWKIAKWKFNINIYIWIFLIVVRWSRQCISHIILQFNILDFILIVRWNNSPTRLPVSRNLRYWPILSENGHERFFIC